MAESGRHKRTGYSNVTCPFCTGHAGYHRGFNHKTGGTVCFRCPSSQPTQKTLSLILGVSYQKVKEILSKYTTGFIETDYIQFSGVEEVDIQDLNLKSLSNSHWNYLDDRGYDVHELENLFHLKSTGYKTEPFWQKDKIYIPYYFGHELVFYTCRDINVTTKQEGGKAKYTAIKQEDCKLIDKHILYNFDRVKHRDSILAFEGPADVWRFPHCSIGLSGVKFLPSQCNLLAKNFKRVIFILDPDAVGSAAAEKCFNEMICMGNEVECYEITDLEKDPGNMTYTEANKIIKELNL